MNMPAWPLDEPVADQLCFVCAVIVHDNMDVEIGRHVALDLVKELAELLCAMAWHAFADNGSRLYVERGKQRGGSVPLIVVGVPLGLAGPHRQQRLGSIERLDLALFIDAEHHGAFGRREIQANNITYLLDKQRIGRDLEGFRAVRLQAKRLPNPMDRGW